MKSALILLSVLIVLSKQQMRHQSPRDLMYWLSHYYLPHPALNHYNNYHPFNYDYNQGYPPFLRRFTSARPMDTFIRDDKDPYFSKNFTESTEDVDEDIFPDAQSRVKVFNRHRPFFQPKPVKDPRVVINLATETNFFNRKVKTITFTVTSSVTFTSVQSCIPSGQFFTGAADITCRRKKRRGIVETQGFSSEESQLAIAPSDVQPVEPTALSLMTTKNSSRLANEQMGHHEIVSSKNEETDDVLEYTSPSAGGYSRGKRLFFHLVTTSTLISYTFISTTITKTVNLLNTFFFGGGQLICRPEGYAVCPYTSAFFG